MLGLEIEIMVIRIRRKPDLLDLGGLALGLHLLFLSLLLVKEFIVIDDLTDRRGGVWRDLDEVEGLILRHLHGFLDGVNAYRYIVAYQSYLWHPDHMVGTMFLLLLFSKTWIESPSRGSRWWKCHLQLLISASLPAEAANFLSFFDARP